MSEFEFTSSVCRVDGGVQPHALPIPHEVSEVLWAEGFKRLLVKFNDRELRRGLQGSRDIGSHIVVGLALLKEMGVREGDEILVSVKPDPDPDRIDVCDELLIAFEQDLPAKERWDTLALGKQRGLAYHVGSAKQEGTRIKRALDVAMKLRTRTLHGD